MSKALEKSNTPMSTRCLCAKDSNRSCTVNISWVSQENPERKPLTTPGDNLQLD